MQHDEIIKVEEKRKRQIIDKHRKQDGIKNQTRSFIDGEIRKKREWSTLRKEDQLENLTINQKATQNQKQKLIEKHIGIKKQLDTMKQSQSFLIEQRKR